MSSSSDSSSSSSGSEPEESVNEEIVEFSGIVPYDEDLEPLATAEEAAQHEARMAEEAEIERQYQARFTREVELATWCFCSNCSVDLATKAEECQCCQEIDRCGEVMEEFGDPKRCITLHPGFHDVCLSKHVLEVAALGLKTKSGKSYKTLFLQGQRTEEKFLRAVAYRQFTRLLWDYIGSSRRYPLPCCAYNKIRKHFPDENGQYHGFEDDDN